MEQGVQSITRTGAAQRRLPRGEQTRQQILEVAVQIASEEGLEDLTIGRLATELGMSKSGLFAHFGSKEDLQLATIEAARAIFVNAVVQPAQVAERGMARLHAMLDSWISYGERGVFRGGCFFAAAAAEFDGRPGPVRDRLVVVTKSWLDALIDEAREAQARGELKANTDPVQLGFELHAFGMETNWAFQLLADERAFDRARAAMRQTLERAATPKGVKALPSQPKARTKSKAKR